MTKLFSLFVLATFLGACAVEGNYTPPTGAGGWSGGESREESRERSGSMNPGETKSPDGVDDSGTNVGFGPISG